MVLRRLTAQIQTQTDSNTDMNVSCFNEELSFTLIYASADGCPVDSFQYIKWI